MDIKRSINTRMWADSWFESLTPTEKLIWVYLLTNAQTNMLGIYQVSRSRIQYETGVDKVTLSKALEGFEMVKKAYFWFDEWVFLPNWIKNQSMNPNMATSARNLYQQLPNIVINKLKENAYEGFESLSKGSITLPNIRKLKVENRKLKVETRDERISAFKKEVEQHTETVILPKNEVQRFILYWTEPNKKGDMRFELQPTWDTAGRLRTWLLNIENKKIDNRTGKPTNKEEDDLFIQRHKMTLP